MLSLALRPNGTMPDRLRVTDGRLSPCPDTPNCVSSDAIHAAHRVEPFKLVVPAGRAWESATEVVAALPRARIVARTDDYLHAECRSALLRFVDDLELHLRPGEGLIAVRSSSRLGYYDFGVNRRRVEQLRDRMRRMSVIQ